MYDIIFYEDKRGKSPVFDFINDLASKKAKTQGLTLTKYMIT